MTRLFLPLFGLFTLLLGGCATTVKVDVRQAPALDLPGVRSLSVESFAVGGKVPKGLEPFVIEEEASGSGGRRSRTVREDDIIMFKDKIRDLNSSLERMQSLGLKDALKSDGFFEVKESGAADAKLAGVVNYEVTSKINDELKRNGRRVYVLTVKATVTVSFNVLTNDGILLGSTKIDSSVEKRSEGDSAEEARDNAAPWEPLVRQALNLSQLLLVSKISPHFVTETRILEEGEGDAVKAGNAAAKRGDWPEAAAQWNVALAGGSPTEVRAATWNLAVHDEVEGRLAEALRKYEGLAKDGDGKYAAEASRIRGRIAEEEKLRIQAIKRRFE